MAMFFFNLLKNIFGFKKKIEGKEEKASRSLSRLKLKDKKLTIFDRSAEKILSLTENSFVGSGGKVDWKANLLGSESSHWPNLTSISKRHNLGHFVLDNKPLEQYELGIDENNIIYLIFQERIVGSYNKSLVISPDHMNKCLSIPMIIAKSLYSKNLQPNPNRKMTVAGRSALKSTHRWLKANLNNKNNFNL